MSKQLALRNLNDMDIFDNIFNQSYSWLPPLDIYETDNELQILVELPGVSKSDVSLVLENDLLTVSGAKNVEKKNKTKSERKFGSFSRSIRLDSNYLNINDVQASFKDGVLEITISKKESVKAKSITIK